MVIQSPLLLQIPNIQHGFGTLSEPFPKKFEAWPKPEWKQTHSDQYAKVIEANQQCGEVDALYTEVPHLCIAMRTADCIPILLSHPNGKKVAAIHAGWKGVKNRIVQKLWKQLMFEGEQAKEWIAAVGPCIRSCCYEVSSELIIEFKKEFHNMDPNKISPKTRMLDMQEIITHQLKELGLVRIDILQHCTYCSQTPSLNSYRRGDKDLRQHSAIGIIQ